MTARSGTRRALVPRFGAWARAKGASARWRAPAPGAFATFGEGSWLVPPCTVGGAGRVAVGRGTTVMELAAVEVEAGGRVDIGDGCRFGRGLRISCATAVDIGPAVSGSDFVTILDGVVVEDGAYLGCGSIVGPGVRVGAGAYVGEGAVVTDDVPAHAAVFGNPAVVVA